jgi:hypothetical protein
VKSENNKDRFPFICLCRLMGENTETKRAHRRKHRTGKSKDLPLGRESQSLLPPFPLLLVLLLAFHPTEARARTDKRVEPENSWHSLLFPCLVLLVPLLLSVIAFASVVDSPRKQHPPMKPSSTTTPFSSEPSFSYELRSHGLLFEALALISGRALLPLHMAPPSRGFK